MRTGFSGSWDRVKECDFAFVLITPSSVYKPWILWEAGAVYGAALATGKEGLRKVRPLVYQIGIDQIPSPIRESKTQFKRGDKIVEVGSLFKEIIDQYKNALTTDRLAEIFKKLDSTIEIYMERVRAALLNAPLLPTSVVIEEWRLRLDSVLKNKRVSEVEHLHDWMDIAFGRAKDDKPQPIDLRIHSRLGEIYLAAKNYDKAIQQFDLARQLAPRDIFVLRTLGQAYLASGRHKDAKMVIDRIEELDKDAFVHNTECAALLGRWHRDGNDLEAAENVYHKALKMNSHSYYLADILAQVRLNIGNKQGAEKAFKQALDIIEGIGERNLWTYATAANAAFFIGEIEKTKSYLKAIGNLNPSPNELTIIEDGLQRLAVNLEGGKEKLKAILKYLRR